MGLYKTDRQKEWFLRLLRRLLDPLHRFGRDGAVGVCLVGHIRRFIRGALREVRRPALAEIRESRFLTSQTLPRPAFRQCVSNHLRAPVGHAPRGRIFLVSMADVKDLAESFGAISVRLEMLR